MQRGVRCSSIVNPLGIPAVFGAINTKQRVGNRDVPFLTRPAFAPPLPLATPGAACRGDLAMHSGKSDPCGNAVEQVNRGLQRWTKESQARTLGVLGILAVSSLSKMPH